MRTYTIHIQSRHVEVMINKQLSRIEEEKQEIYVIINYIKVI